MRLIARNSKMIVVQMTIIRPLKRVYSSDLQTVADFSYKAFPSRLTKQKAKTMELESPGRVKPVPFTVEEAKLIVNLKENRRQGWR